MDSGGLVLLHEFPFEAVGDVRRRILVGEDVTDLLEEQVELGIVGTVVMEQCGLELCRRILFQMRFALIL